MSRKKQRGNLAERYDRHHVFYQRRHYTTSLAKALRDHPYCLVPIPRDSLHHAIHNVVVDVPVPEAKVLKTVLRRLDALWDAGTITPLDTIEQRLELLITLLTAAPATQQALQAQLVICRQYPRR